MAEQKRKNDQVNFGGGPGLAMAAGLNNTSVLGGASSPTRPAAAAGAPVVNVGFGQSRPATPAGPRAPSLAQRAVRGDFQIQRPQRAGPEPVINVGLGGRQSGGAAPAPAAPGAILAPASPAMAAPAPMPAAAPLAQVAPPPAQALAAPAPVARPDFSNVTTLAPGTPNTYTGGNGITRRVDPGPAPAAAAPQGGAPPLLRPAAVQAPASAAPQVQQSVTRAVDAQRGQTLAARGDAAEMLNPMSNSAELMRRLENSQSSYFHKGSPQARRLIGEAIAGQLGAQNAATAQGQRSAGETIERGVGYEAGAMEGAARRQLDADTFNADDSYRQRALEAEVSRPTLQADAQGNLLSIAGTAAAPVTGADGSQVRLARPQEPGQITPAALLESYSQQARAIAEGLGTPEEKAQQHAALRTDPIYASIFGQQQGAAPGAPPSAGAFVKAMRERGSKMSDAQLTAYYNQNYGK